MKKIKTIITTIVMLWLLSYFLSFGIGNEKVIDEGVAIIPIKGAILPEDSNDIFGASGMGSDTIMSSLKRAMDNDGIKAVVLEINSPGGTVVASREVANFVKALSEEKPVVAWIREVGASGAYWIASSSDYIIADELSITGSVGVISSYLEFSELLEKYGVRYERLVAGELKDVGSPYRDLNDAERKLMESKLKKIQDVFLKEVSENRKLTPSQVDEIRSGFFYLGIEAKELGLVDDLGGRELAIEKAKDLGKIEDGNIVEYKPKKSLIELIEKFTNKAFFNLGRGIWADLAIENKLEILAM
ncbi:signal peptide peptidase SppA [Candidatus Woesearchaeota archaeon]|nr:signal peptide peptidase SppA [Candidatus Woesearchaeota archaeon]